MLRDYQIEICKRVREAFARHRSVMVQMPTGTGKTVVLASFLNEELRMKSEEWASAAKANEEWASAKVLIVAHRRELIEQIKETIKKMVAPLPPSEGMAPLPPGEGMAPLPPGGGIVVESIQTISRRIGNPPSGGWGGRFSLVIIDEAHHALAKTYKMMWEAWPDAKFLGLTATPWRMSGDGFTDLFEVLVQSQGIKRFIADGWLCPYDYYSVKPDSEDQKRIDSLTKRGAGGDYQTKEMREKLDDTPCIERLFATYKRHADGKKGIVYAIDIEHAEHIAEYYKLHGVDAVAISSKTPKDKREEIIKRFKDPLSPGGGLLVSVDLFSEGFDCPDVEFIQIARPTLSLAKYLQMVGRGLRAHQDKVCCTIIDHVGLYRAFGLPSADRDWQGAFCGFKNERIKELKLLNNDGGWIPSALLEDKGDDVVKIVSHVGMPSLFEGIVDAGFERTRNADGKYVWIDKVNGVTFRNVPKVVDFSGLELSTDDGVMFYPRIASPLIDKDNGIHYNLLKMQVGDGILWKKRYVSLKSPTQVFALQETLENGVRIFKDREGRTLLQQDPNHPLVTEEEMGREEVIRRCNAERQRINRINGERNERYYPTYVKKFPWMRSESKPDENWLQPVRCCNKNGVCQKMIWNDMKTYYVYQQKPDTLWRGCVELLRDDGLLYVRNIEGQAGYAYPNYAIRADNRICIIGNILYLKKYGTFHSFKIKKKSEDLTVFMVKDVVTNYMIVNKPGQDLEMTYMSIDEKGSLSFIH